MPQRASIRLNEVKWKFASIVLLLFAVDGEREATSKRNCINFMLTSQHSTAQQNARQNTLLNGKFHETLRRTMVRATQWSCFVHCIYNLYRHFHVFIFGNVGSLSCVGIDTTYFSLPRKLFVFRSLSLLSNVPPIKHIHVECKTCVVVFVLIVDWKSQIKKRRFLLRSHWSSLHDKW